MTEKLEAMEALRNALAALSTEERNARADRLADIARMRENPQKLTEEDVFASLEQLREPRR